MAGWLTERLRGAGPMLAVMLFILLLGLMLGLAAPQNVDAETLGRTRLMVGNYIQALPEAGIDPGEEFRRALALNGALILGIGLAGLHLLGLPLIAALLFLKGLSLGYAMSFLLDYQGVSGFAIIFLSMLPQHLLLLPLTVLAAYLAAAFSLSLFCHPPSPRSLVFYSLRGAALLLLTALAALVQGYVCPLLLKMFFIIV